jgi:hypothetical protein
MFSLDSSRCNPSDPLTIVSEGREDSAHVKIRVDTDEVGFRFPMNNESNQTVGFYQKRNILDMLLYFPPEI